MLSFSEILVILLVAVIVLGPKRLPSAARKVGHYVGLIRRVADSFKRDLMMMDQAANRAINHATKDFDNLYPKETADLAEVLGVPEDPPIVTSDHAPAQSTACASEEAPSEPPEALRPSVKADVSTAPAASSPATPPTGGQGL